MLPIFLGLSSIADAGAVVHHDLIVVLDPPNGTIHVRDSITLPERSVVPPEHVFFELAAGAELTGGNAVTEIDSPSPTVRRYRFEPAPVASRLQIHYRWKVIGTDRAYLDGRGAYLDRAAGWFPEFGTEYVSFRMEVRVPAGWTAVSQGARTRSEATDSGVTVGWEEIQPQQDIYLIAGKFVEYLRDTAGIEAMVFLREPDSELAGRYLDVTGDYVDRYNRLIGSYPYAKFALIENIEETGYGMPSFTLLGPRVIRLPFILHTSYPHEILHNWWGNSVYVDYESGNWSEGLTAYLADHLNKELEGQAAQYRRDALQKYLSYVDRERDFPLTAFRAKHGTASEAVGYNKALMFFHMLRRQLGDDRFYGGLRRFYADNRFRRASYADLRAAFEANGEPGLAGLFAQWTQRTGAPALRLREVRLGKHDGRFHVTGKLEQTQPDPPYVLSVPVRLLFGAEREPINRRVSMDGRVAELSLDVPVPPQALIVDPEFDVFRRLDRAEVPPTLGELYGSPRVAFVLPRAATDAERELYTRFARAWQTRGAELTVHYDDEVPPAGAALWAFGWRNRLRERFEPLFDRLGARMSEDRLTLGGTDYDRGAGTVVLAARYGADRPVIWMAMADDQPVEALARRLPHFNRYSYLVFADGNPVERGQWTVTDSPLRVDFGD